MKKRFLVCGIRGAERRNVSSFFVSREDEGLRFCEALVSGEGEAKKILSTYEIDEIIVIGSVSLLGKKGAAGAGKKMALNDDIDLMTADVSNLSGFDFFRYRMMQFTMGASIDLADSLGEIDPARREELIAFARSLGTDTSALLPALFAGKSVRSKFDKAAGELPLEDLDWLFRYLYCETGSFSKMRPKSQNLSIPISFVPISSSLGFEDVTLFQDLIASLLQEPGSEAELYIDFHGLPTEAAGVCASTLYSLSDDPNARIHIAGSASVHNADLPGFSWVDMQQRHYRIDKLMAGIRSFLNNGKTDILRSYWEEAKFANPKLENRYVDEILMAMGYVDAGISLCNIDELMVGLMALRRLLNHPELASEPSQEEDAFVVMMLRESVLADYGALMDDSAEELDPFELVKWGFRKKFFQQVITIIESLIPAQLIARGVIYPATTGEEVLAYKKAVNLHYWDGLPTQRWSFKDLDHYFVKFYGRFAVDYRNRAIPPNTQYARIRAASVFGDSLERLNVLPAHSLLTDEALLADILERYYSLGAFRNSVNHAERLDDAATSLEPVSPIWKQAEKLIGGFIACYEKVLAAIGDKRPDDLKPLVPEEFKEYFFEHGPKSDPEYNTIVGFTPSNRARPRRRSFDGADRRGDGDACRSAGDDGNRGSSGTAGNKNGNHRGGNGGGNRRGNNGNRRGGRGNRGNGGRLQDSVAVPVPGELSSENVTVTVSLPKSTIDDLKSDKSKKGELVVRLSFE